LTVVLNGTMEGRLQIAPGDTVSAGYDFTMTDSHGAVTIMISGYVAVHVHCGETGGNYDIIIPFPCVIYELCANNDSWIPSSDQGSSLTYQGSVTAGDICGNEGMCDASSGATLYLNVTASSTTDVINVRFHYGSNVGSAGTSWSTTVGACQVPLCSSVALLQAPRLEQRPLTWLDYIALLTSGRAEAAVAKNGTGQLVLLSLAHVGASVLLLACL
jgi:hypothetical protein